MPKKAIENVILDRDDLLMLLGVYNTIDALVDIISIVSSTMLSIQL